MKTNRDESKADRNPTFGLGEGGPTTLTGWTLEVEDCSRPPRPRSEGWTPAPPYASELTKAWREGAALGKMQAEIELRARASAKMYGWPIVPALKVQHPEPYTPGQRDYAKLLEAAKRKPVGYVTTKAEVENTTDTLPPPVVAYMGDKPALWSSALDASNATAKAPTAKPDAEWPKVLMPKDGAGSLYVPCAYNSGHESMTYLSSGEINKSVLNSYSDTLACGNHRPGTMAELVAWLRANGHQAEADRLEVEDKKALNL